MAIADVYPEPGLICKVENIAKIVNGKKQLTIFEKFSILNVWQVSKYASALFMMKHLNINKISNTFTT